MKKVIVIVIALMIVGVTCANAQARRHHRNNDSDVLAGFLGGVIVGILSDGNRYYSGGHYNYDRQRQAARQRARQHEQAIQRYESCLAQREVDIYYGVPPQHAKDCSRYHPANRRWNY